MAIVYLNGQFLSQEKAMVSALDRGFLFADGVYEVIPAYQGRLFRLNQHLGRLHQSLQATRIDPELGDAEIEAMLNQLITENGGGNLSVYLQITRGAYASRDHLFPKNANNPTVFAFCSPMKTPDIDQLNQMNGQRAITAKDIRWDYCYIKSVSLLPNILLMQQAAEAGAAEAILIRNGLLTEGTASNVFLVKDQVIKTPPLSQHLLGGITRDLIIELCLQAALPLRECPIDAEELSQADEIWITSSVKEITPITKLDDNPVGDGHIGPVWQKVAKLYCEYKRQLCLPQ